jgi:hypothetical protein
MAIVRRSPYRWWVPLVAIVGSMLATANASASAMGDSIPSEFDADRVALGGREIVHSTLLPRGSTHLRFNAEDSDDYTVGDDDTDVPVRAWFRDMIRSTHDLVLTQSDSRSAISPPVPPSLFERLRC